ncbi:MAG: uroporphyrinogen-III synthase [Thermoplasmata archaeon]
MPRRVAPTIVLLTAPGTLREIDAPLQKAGVRVVRLEAVRPRPVDPRRWLPRVLRVTSPDTVVVTSRAGVDMGIRPWRSERVPPSGLEFWAVGPGTALALRTAGIRGIHRPAAAGASNIAKALRKTKRRRILYFRSSAAGPRLADRLRADGHRVQDAIVYRLVAPRALTAEERQEIARADLLVISSPSALSLLRRRLDSPTFSRLSERARVVVLGERSQRAAHGHGFQHVSVAPSTTAQRFTRHLLQELRDASE